MTGSVVGGLEKREGVQDLKVKEGNQVFSKRFLASSAKKPEKKQKRTPEAHACFAEIIMNVKLSNVEGAMAAIRQMISVGSTPDSGSCTAVLSILITDPVKWDYVEEVGVFCSRML